VRQETGQAGTPIEFVVVSPEMEKAGVERARELLGETDLRYFVSAIYLAMEYERLAMLGQLRGFTNQPLKVR
jgi:hypothetical protein